MNILVASGIFHPDPGGPATYLYRLLPELQQRGHSVRVLSYGNAPSSGYPYPVQRIPFGRLPLVGTPIRWLRYALAYQRLARWADVIYLNTFGLPRLSEPPKRTVMKIVGDYAWERSVTRGWLPPDEDVDAFQTRAYAPRVEAYKTLRSRDAVAMDRIIVPSAYLGRMVTGWGVAADKVQVIYNALEGSPAALSATKREARSALGWSGDGHYLFTAARLTAWKGIDHLITALSDVHKVILVVAGEGPDMPRLRGLVHQWGVNTRIQFVGALPREKIPLYLRAADYLALYSGYEGLSHTILEALQMGTPVIASDRGGNPEIIRDGVNGWLVPHPNGDALRETLGKAFHEGRIERLAARTQHGLERFSWVKLVEETVMVLEG
ncbi:MAG TPA: glycosyltransferase family 4 protein [Aggregatilineales bacterium]|nr:glycosyltransferase family 4 protein [Anaerolineales bacterium]HRE48779.1 glycosyltransferase family 4 protein [Aggregatilineales bacterium]